MCSLHTLSRRVSVLDKVQLCSMEMDLGAVCAKLADALGMWCAVDTAAMCDVPLLLSSDVAFLILEAGNMPC